VPELDKPLKTWSHLAQHRRKPTEYEIVSTNLLWSTSDREAPWAMGPEIAVSRHVLRYRNHSRLSHDDWDGFRDPSQLVYRTYNAAQDGQEAYVDGLLEDHARNEHDFGLGPAWVAALGRLYTPGRFLMHALQMAAAYGVFMAPASTIANCFAFQSGDQLRWVSRIAYRTAELTRAHPNARFGSNERSEWESAPEWQGFRELAERALVAWDWGEQFVAVNLVAKVAVDAAVLRQFGRAARREGDSLTGFLTDAQLIDSERSRAWSTALWAYATAAPTTVAATAAAATTADANRRVLGEWLAQWAPLGERAIDTFCAGFDGTGRAARDAKQEMRAFHAELCQL
jgi:toluene monooxygenase system protein E